MIKKTIAYQGLQLKITDLPGDLKRGKSLQMGIGYIEGDRSTCYVSKDILEGMGKYLPIFRIDSDIYLGYRTKAEVQKISATVGRASSIQEVEQMSVAELKNERQDAAPYMIRVDPKKGKTYYRKNPFFGKVEVEGQKPPASVLVDDLQGQKYRSVPYGYSEIGSGAYGQVYHKKGSSIVIKFGQIEETEFKNQAIAAKAGVAPKIYSITKGKKKYHHAITMERLDGETLYESVVNQSGNEEEDAKKLEAVTWNTVEAIAKLHSAGIVHTDLHQGNVFVDGNRQVKIIDYGLAKQFTPEEVDYQKLQADYSLVAYKMKIEETEAAKKVKAEMDLSDTYVGVAKLNTIVSSYDKKFKGTLAEDLRETKSHKAITSLTGKESLSQLDGDTLIGLTEKNRKKLIGYVNDLELEVDSYLDEMSLGNPKIRIYDRAKRDKEIKAEVGRFFMDRMNKLVKDHFGDRQDSAKDKSIRKQGNKSWVKDLSVKGGGFWRKLPRKAKEAVKSTIKTAKKNPIRTVIGVGGAIALGASVAVVKGRESKDGVYVGDISISDRTKAKAESGEIPLGSYGYQQNGFSAIAKEYFNAVDAAFDAGEQTREERKKIADRIQLAKNYNGLLYAQAKRRAVAKTNPKHAIESWSTTVLVEDDLRSSMIDELTKEDLGLPEANHKAWRNYVDMANEKTDEKIREIREAKLPFDVVEYKKEVLKEVMRADLKAIAFLEELMADTSIRLDGSSPRRIKVLTPKGKKPYYFRDNPHYGKTESKQAPHPTTGDNAAIGTLARNIKAMRDRDPLFSFDSLPDSYNLNGGVYQKLSNGAYGVVYLSQKSTIVTKFGEIARDEVNNQAIASQLGLAPRIRGVYKEGEEYTGLSMEKARGATQSEYVNALQDHVKDKKLTYDQMEKLQDRVCLKTLRELQTLHKNNIVHGDLHRGNIFVDDTENITFIDYGHATKYPKTIPILEVVNEDSSYVDYNGSRDFNNKPKGQQIQRHIEKYHYLATLHRVNIQSEKLNELEEAVKKTPDPILVKGYEALHRVVGLPQLSDEDLGKMSPEKIKEERQKLYLADKAFGRLYKQTAITPPYSRDRQYQIDNILTPKYLDEMEKILGEK